MEMKSPNLAVQIGGGLVLKNPVMTASGTFGYGAEFADLVRLASLGAIVAKGISLAPRPGNPAPRVVETPCGMLNAIGLENVGVEAFIDLKLPFLRQAGAAVVVNILGDRVDDYQKLAARLAVVPGIDALELNISCPNVAHGGIAFGSNPDMAAAVTRAARSAWPGTLIVKLSPNVTDITNIARAVEDAGADAVSLINTLLGMKIDIKSRRPCLANITGGLSGPAIRPVALRMVWQVAGAVRIPVVGIGGISSTEDALEFLLAGASAVQVGTANFVDPRTPENIIAGIADYLRQEGLADINSIIGAARCSRPGDSAADGVCDHA